jgi:hypothetical protein
MTETRRVFLTKAERGSGVGQELIALLLELSDDGQVTRDEMNRLRHWLEVDRGVEFPACAFLYELIDTIAADGEVTDAELDRLMLGIERVLPNDVRNVAREKRKQHREVRRVATVAARATARAEAVAARERTRVLHRADFVIAGVRFSERREACELLDIGDQVVLEREPDNRHDKNAIFVLASDGSELGYVPRADAREMAPLLDDGAVCDATVKKLLHTHDEMVLPVVVSLIRWEHETASPAAASISPGDRSGLSEPFTGSGATAATAPGSPTKVRRGCFAVLLLFGAALLVLVTVMLGSLFGF